MKIILSILFILCLCWMAGYSQPAPGGVADPVCWLVNEPDASGRLVWNARTAGLQGATQLPVSEPGDTRLLNFHSVAHFDGLNNGLVFMLPETVDLSRATFFSVQQVDPVPQERVIWMYEIDRRNHLLLGRDLFADLEDLRYLNFPKTAGPKTFLFTYFHHRRQKSSTPQHRQLLRIGYDAGHLPVAPLRGLVPEIVIYDRALGGRERLQVESYLALKYGLPLLGWNGAPADYLNASGDRIWNGWQHRPFTHHVTGFGRDDASGLATTRASNSLESGLLTVAASTPAMLQNQQFLMWGDDAAELSWAPQSTGSPQRLQRRWMMAPVGDLSEQPTTVRFDVGQLDPTLESDLTYWLVIDRSGSGTFEAGQVVYLPGTYLREGSAATFEGVHWDPDQSGTDVFSIAKGPAFMTLLELNAPVCHPATNGSIHAVILGGRPPYTAMLTNKDTRITQVQSGLFEERIHFSELPPGNYELEVIDRGGNTFREAFYFQSADAPVSDLMQRYELQEGETLLLDGRTANTPETVRMHWIPPGGTIEPGPAIRISRSGTYQLVMEDAGCMSQWPIEVVTASGGPIRQARVFPNPVQRDEPFTVHLDLERRAPLRLTIVDPSGQTIRSRQLSGRLQYQIRERLPVAGTYQLVLQSGIQTKTISLIVQ